MDKLEVISTPLPACLLRAACRHYGIGTARLSIQAGDGLSAGSDDDSGPPVRPPAVFLQSGGLEALAAIGLSIDALPTAAAPIERIAMLDEKGKCLVAYEVGSVGLHKPCWVATQALDSLLDRGAFLSEKNQPGQSAAFSSGMPALRRWQSAPGVFISILCGSFAPACRSSMVMVDDSRVIVGFAPLSSQRLVLFAMPRQVDGSPVQQRQVQDACERVKQRFGGRYAQFGSVEQECWIPRVSAGYRDCWDGRRLWWGGTSLRLHPLSGQFLSYWAIQSQRLAEALRLYSFPKKQLEAINRQQRQLFRAHLRTLHYHWCPSIGWRFIRKPYAALLSRSTPLRRRVMRRFALLRLNR